MQLRQLKYMRNSKEIALKNEITKRDIKALENTHFFDGISIFNLEGVLSTKEVAKLTKLPEIIIETLVEIRAIPHRIIENEIHINKPYFFAHEILEWLKSHPNRMEHKIDDTILTKEDICEILRMPLNVINILITNGLIPHRIISKRYIIFLTSEIEEWIDNSPGVRLQEIEYYNNFKQSLKKLRKVIKNA